MQKSIQRDLARFQKLKSLTWMERNIKYRSKLNPCRKQNIRKSKTCYTLYLSRKCIFNYRGKTSQAFVTANGHVSVREL